MHKPCALCAHHVRYAHSMCVIQIRTRAKWAQSMCVPRTSCAYYHTHTHTFMHNVHLQRAQCAHYDRATSARIYIYMSTACTSNARDAHIMCGLSTPACMHRGAHAIRITAVCVLHARMLTERAPSLCAQHRNSLHKEVRAENILCQHGGLYLHTHGRVNN